VGMASRMTVAEVVERLARPPGPPLIAIDGLPCSGKSTLAETIAGRYGYDGGVSELEQLAANAFGAPQTIVEGHAANQSDDVCRQPGRRAPSAWSARSPDDETHRDASEAASLLDDAPEQGASSSNPSAVGSLNVYWRVAETRRADGLHAVRDLVDEGIGQNCPVRPGRIAGVLSAPFPPTFGILHELVGAVCCSRARWACRLGADPLSSGELRLSGPSRIVCSEVF
jgi:hypothetical protein